MKKNISNIILIVIFLAGLSLLLYPSFSDYWNSFTQSRAIASYSEYVEIMGADSSRQILEEARAYNDALAAKPFDLLREEEEYKQVLDITGTGIMGYIEIPSIKCYLPIYHGTDEAVLQIAAGHIEGTSLPIGGEGTHCVVSGHRGLPSAKLFTDIDKLVPGDEFYIRVLNETLTYEVDQINIVLPEEVDLLHREEGEDLATLVTCTPYGINTHRLLVRGHRIATVEHREVRVTAEAAQIEPKIIALVLAIPMLFILLVVMLFKTRKKR